jgi:wyosine [tRNA(Phe)-imidazoG37] synthetase (radical SAM superfamily)
MTKYEEMINKTTDICGHTPSMFSGADATETFVPYAHEQEKMFKEFVEIVKEQDSEYAVIYTPEWIEYLREESKISDEVLNEKAADFISSVEQGNRK